MLLLLAILLPATLVIFALAGKSKGYSGFEKGSFGYDFHFLKKHHPDLILLRDEAGQAQVIVIPAYQARIMTSTASGLPGQSFGWINHDLIASGEKVEHMNVFGGEDRYWMGPEGGQFSIFFKKGLPFTFEHWQVPPELDTEPFDLLEVSQTEARLRRDMLLENYSGTRFQIAVERNIRLLSKSKMAEFLGVNLPKSLRVVGIESENILSNKGEQAWTKENGLLSIWIASMLNAGPKTTVMIPFREGEEAELGKIVTDDYFGKIPADRLWVKEGVMYFKADGKQRGKLGTSPERTVPKMGAWDAKNKILTLAQFSFFPENTEYVNSLWEDQREPFRGDVINAYNDGPNDTGKQMGAFYELESSSPAAALAPGASITHVHRIMHFKGNFAALAALAKSVLGAEIQTL